MLLSNDDVHRELRLSFVISIISYLTDIIRQRVLRSLLSFFCASSLGANIRDRYRAEERMRMRYSLGTCRVILPRICINSREIKR